MKLGHDIINGRRIEIDIDAAGNFSATFDDQTFSDKTHAGLLEKLKKAIKKAAAQGTVDVTVIGIVKQHDSRYNSSPFTAGPGYLQAKLRGPHERSYNTWLLVTDDARYSKPVKFQIQGTREGRICRRLTDAECRRYIEIAEARRAAATALEDFEGETSLNLEEALSGARKGKA